MLLSFEKNYINLQSLTLLDMAKQRANGVCLLQRMPFTLAVRLMRSTSIHRIGNDGHGSGSRDHRLLVRKRNGHHTG